MSGTYQYLSILNMYLQVQVTNLNFNETIIKGDPDNTMILITLH